MDATASPVPPPPMPQPPPNHEGKISKPIQLNRCSPHLHMAHFTHLHGPPMYLLISLVRLPQQGLLLLLLLLKRRRRRLVLLLLLLLSPILLLSLNTRRSRRKFRSETSDNMDRWKSRGGKSQRGEEQKRKEKRRNIRSAGARKSRKVAKLCFSNNL